MAAPFRTLFSACVNQRRLFLLTPINNLSRSGSEFGPLTDLPDWSFADGRPAPPLTGQLRRRQEREKLVRRIVMLSSEMDKGIEAWTQRQDKAKQLEEHKKSQLLKPKGRLLTKKEPKS
ncbi:hypothetical protein WMY93_015037 [Mugilogobius chulae]|uniref:Large ribosomal subunit protein mL52 n=1 Tax=Mugilogobius chulae TaxID=88201 RepID=A0AAW0P6Y9_9GOBI